MYDFSNDKRFNDIKKISGKCLLSSPTIHGDELEYITQAFESGWITTAGENIIKLESEIAEYIGTKHAVALSSGTAALHLAIKLAGEKLYGQAKPGYCTLENRRVFCSDLTFDATVNPVAYEGGECVFIDTEYDTWNMSPEALSCAFDLYPDVKLIVLAHLYGVPGKIDEIRAIADAHKALIVEDAAESLGAKYLVKDGNKSTRTAGNTRSSEKEESKGQWLQTGTFGDIGIISFNGNKIITGSSGGMLLCESKHDADKVRKWSTQSREDAPWYQHEEIGFNYRMSNLIAGCVRGQFNYLEEHISQKKAIYERYREGLVNLPIKMNPYDSSKTLPNYWLSCMIIDEDSMAPMVRGEKDQLWIHESGKSSPGEILDALKYFGAEGRPIWKPMHLQPIYRSNAFVTKNGSGRAQSNAYIKEVGMVDVGLDVFNRGLCLPSDNKMSVEQQDRVIETIRRCFQ